MKKIKILVTGAFDILHQEHLIFLKKAKKMGDILVVGVESDSRVRNIKGQGRPIYDQKTRVKNIENLKIADQVFILPEKFDQTADHLALIKKINPAILAVSSHTSHLDKKKKIMALVGGELKIIHDHNPQISSTILLKSNSK